MVYFFHQKYHNFYSASLRGFSQIRGILHMSCHFTVSTTLYIFCKPRGNEKKNGFCSIILCLFFFSLSPPGYKNYAPCIYGGVMQK